MKDIKNRLGLRGKRKEATVKTYHGPSYIPNGKEEEIRYTALCFFIVSTVKEDTVEIRINKKDDDKKVDICCHIYELCKEAGYQTTLFNYKTRKKKIYYPPMPTRAEDEKEVDICEVDYDSLIAAIKELQDEKKEPFVRNGLLDKFYFAVIFKMLIDGAFGIENNNISQQNFINLLNRDKHYNIGTVKNMSLHLDHIKGNFPEITIRPSKFKKNTDQKNHNLKTFIEDIVSKYQDKANTLLANQ